MEDLKLSDEVIGHIAKVLQLALLTGTDIVDNLRMLRLQNADGVLNVHPLSQEMFDKSIHEMIADVELMKMQKHHLSETGEEMPAEMKSELREMVVGQAREATTMIDLTNGSNGDVDEW